MRTVFATCVLGIVANIAFAEYSGGYRGPNRDGIYPATGLLKKWPEGGPKLLWKHENVGDGFSSVVVVDKNVYVTGKNHDGGAKNGYLHCFTIDGQFKWKKKYGPETATGRFEGPRATPEFVDGGMCFTSGKGSLYCMDAETGDMKWQVDLIKEYGLKVPGWGYNETPLAVGDKLVMSTRRGDVSLVAIDAKTGETVWTTPQPASPPACGNSSAVLVNPGKANVIIHHLWSAIVALDPYTGRVLWTTKTRTGSELTPVHKDGYLFIATGLDKSYKMLKLAPDGLTSEELWKQPNLQPISQAVFLEGKVFVFGKARYPEGTGAGKSKKRAEPALLCFDVKTGELVKQEVFMEANGSLSAADGMLYCVEGAERYWKTPKISLVKPTPDGFEVTGSFTPITGTKEVYVNVTIAQGRMFHRHGRLLAVYDLRADDSQ